MIINFPLILISKTFPTTVIPYTPLLSKDVTFANYSLPTLTLYIGMEDWKMMARPSILLTHLHLKNNTFSACVLKDNENACTKKNAIFRANFNEWSCAFNSKQ